MYSLSSIVRVIR